MADIFGKLRAEGKVSDQAYHPDRPADFSPDTGDMPSHPIGAVIGHTLGAYSYEGKTYAYDYSKPDGGMQDVIDANPDAEFGLALPGHQLKNR